MIRLPKLDIDKKVNLFIIARVLGKSNSLAEELPQCFQPLFDFDVSYIYSDHEVKLALHDLFVQLLKEEEARRRPIRRRNKLYSFSVENRYRFVAAKPRKTVP
jgi:transposase